MNKYKNKQEIAKEIAKLALELLIKNCGILSLVKTDFSDTKVKENSYINVSVIDSLSEGLDYVPEKGYIPNVKITDIPVLPKEKYWILDLSGNININEHWIWNCADDLSYKLDELITNNVYEIINYTPEFGEKPTTYQLRNMIGSENRVIFVSCSPDHDSPPFETVTRTNGLSIRVVNLGNDIFAFTCMFGFAKGIL